jgi:hypothetical protein
LASDGFLGLERRLRRNREFCVSAPCAPQQLSKRRRAFHLLDLPVDWRNLGVHDHSLLRSPSGPMTDMETSSQVVWPVRVRDCAERSDIDGIDLGETPAGCRCALAGANSRDEDASQRFGVIEVATES